MAELPESSDRNGAFPDAPRWVKVFGVVFAILVLLFVGLHLTGHSLGGHMHGH
jgi:hypothetical protein